MTATRGWASAVRVATGIAAGTLLALAVLPSESVVAFAASNFPTTADQSLTYQIDPAHSGSLPHDTLTPPLYLGWSVNLGAPVSYPVIANARVFVTTGSSSTGTKLYALNLSNGSTAWGPITLGGTYWDATATYDAGRVFTVNYDGKMQAFDENNGAPLWTTQLPGQYAFSSPPTASNGTVYVGGAGSGGTLYAVRESDGAVMWTGSVANGDNSSPAVSGSGVYVSYACAQAYDFNPSTGALIWHHSTSCSGGGGKTPVLANGQLFVRDAITGNVILDATTGNSLGSFAANRAPAISGSRAYFLNGSTLTAMDLSTNAALWTFSGDGALSSAPIVVNGLIYVGSTNGNLYALDQSGATVWTANVGAAINAPDEQNVSQPLTGLAAGFGYLLVPASNTLNLYAGQESLYPGEATWGSQQVGQSSTPAAPFTLTDNTLAPLQIASITVTGDFTQTNNCPSSLTPSTSCVISVTFTPAAAGTRTGTLTVSDNAAGSPHVIPLSGTGVAPSVLDHLVLSPANATISAGASQAYRAEAFDNYNVDMGDVTLSTTFAVDGSTAACSANSCSSTVVGSHTVSGVYQNASGSTGLTVTGPPSRLALTPATATVAAGAYQSYQAEAYDAAGHDLGDVTGSATLTIDAPGITGCTARTCGSSITGTHTVTATYQQASGTASLTVVPGSVTRIRLNPTSATITAGGSQAFTAQTYDSYNNAVADVTSSTTFAIAPSGSCAANSCSATQAGSNYTVTGTYSGLTDTASLAVNAGPFDHLTISPASSTMTAGQSQPYTVFAVDQYGNPSGDASAATWAITPDGSCTVGSGSASCTATVSGSHTVTASLNGKSVTAALTVVPGSATRIRLSPASATITAGGSQAFTAQSYDGYNNVVADVTSSTTFAIAPSGSCAANGCSATQAGSNYTVTGTYAGMTDTASLVVNAGPFDHLTISPTSSTMTAGQYQSYTVFAVDQYGNPSGDASAATWAIAPDGSCTVGSGSASCTATASGPHTVTASLNGKSVTATLTVNPGAVSRIRIGPVIPSMTAGSSQAFTARTVDAYGNTIADVTSSTSFTLSPNGTCSANVCNAPTQATSNANVTGTYNGMTDVISLVINPGPLDHITISPASSTVSAGQSQTYGVMAYDQYNNLVSAGNVTGASSFSITPDGSCTGATCTATRAGAHSVTATYQTKTVSASLGVNPATAATLTLSPASATIVAGGKQTYTATAADQFGNSLGDVTAATAFSVDANTSACAQNVCSSTKAGSHQVVGSYQSVQGTSALTVTAGPAAALTITPTSITLVVGQSAGLTVGATDTYGNPVSTSSAAWSVTTGTPGTVSPTSGSTTTFTASATVSKTGSVIAKLGTLTASSAITVLPAAPTTLTATSPGDHKVNLAWKSAAGASSYTIYRSTGTSGWVAIKSGVTGMTYTDNNLTAGQTYNYYVVAVSSSGLKSAASNTASVVVKN